MPNILVFSLGEKRCSKGLPTACLIIVEVVLSSTEKPQDVLQRLRSPTSKIQDDPLETQVTPSFPMTVAIADDESYGMKWLTNS
eukprot:1473099-Amphidinium_carterae.1